MALPIGIRALALAALVAGTSACAGGGAALRDAHPPAGATLQPGHAGDGEVGASAAGRPGFDPERFSRASALARVARVLAKSADRLSSDRERICAGNSPPPEYCDALQSKIRELRAMATRARAACRKVSSGLVTSVGEASLCAGDPAPTRRVLVIRPVVP